MKILIIEDEVRIVDMLSLTIKIRWPLAVIVSSSTGKGGLQLVEEHNPSLVLLDLGLPDIDGLDVLKQLRTFSSTPVIILTVRKEEADIVEGLEMGADDYVVKPFRQMEILSRISCIMRRKYGESDEVPIIVGPLNFIPAKRRLLNKGKEVFLTTTEAHMLECLMKNAGRVVTFNDFAGHVWGKEYSDDENAIRVYIRRLREKLESQPNSPQLIMTKPGLGYYLSR